MRNNLTEFNYWADYWKGLNPKPINNLYFSSFLKYLPRSGDLLEIGGFPGLYAGYFKKHFNYNVSILDYIIEPLVIKKVEMLYSLPTKSINYIKTDFFNLKTKQKYDVVVSFGFIEHFENIEDVISRHLYLLKKDGVLLITVPNFRGLNGIVQKVFDKSNFKKHNLKAMNKDYVNSILSKISLDWFEIQYIGKPNIWLESTAPVNSFIAKLINFLGKIIRQIPIKKSFLLNSHMIIIAIK